MTIHNRISNVPQILFSMLLIALFSGALITAVLTTTAVHAETTQSISTTCPDPIYVNQSVTGSTETGDSWEDAYTDLQDGLALARTCVVSAASGTAEVWVAAGNYIPTARYRPAKGQPWVTDRTDNYTMTAGVQLYGGFVGTETIRSQRDWETNRVILDGDIDSNQPTENDLITTTDGLNDVENYNVVRMISVTETDKTITSSTVLDGFFITGGRATGNQDPDDSNNYKGGGLNCDGSGANNECSPTLANLYFSGNWGYSGGAIYCGALNGGRCQPTLNNVTFYGNTAFNGGSIENISSDGGVSSPILNNVTFRNGRASTSGASIYNSSDNSTSSPILNNVTFFSNATNNRGGAIYNYAVNGGSSSPIINGMVAYDNIATYGGVMYNYSSGRNDALEPSSSTPSINNATFFNNTARDDGGAIYNDSQSYASSSPTMTNALIYSNTANYGGAIYNVSDNSGESSPLLKNVTLYANQGITIGGSFYNDNDSGSIEPTIINSIIWENESLSGSEFYNVNATVSISYSILTTDSGAIVNGSGGSVSYGANVNSNDPLFADPAGSDGIIGTADDDYQLGTGSPAIDAGDNGVLDASITADLEGNLRYLDDTSIVDTGAGSAPIIDMGAYEAVRFISWITTADTSITDISWQALHSSCTYNLYSDADPYGTLAGGIDAGDLTSTIDVSGAGDDLFHTLQAVCGEMTIEAATVGTFDFSLVSGE